MAKNKRVWNILLLCLFLFSCACSCSCSCTCTNDNVFLVVSQCLCVSFIGCCSRVCLEARNLWRSWKWIAVTQRYGDGTCTMVGWLAQCQLTRATGATRSGLTTRTNIAPHCTQGTSRPARRRGTLNPNQNRSQWHSRRTHQSREEKLPEERRPRDTYNQAKSDTTAPHGHGHHCSHDKKQQKI